MREIEDDVRRARRKRLLARGAAAEYRDPTLFYQRTFLTEGLKRLLVTGLRRLGAAP